MKNFNFFLNKHFRFMAVLCLLIVVSTGNVWGQITVDSNPKTSGTYTITCSQSTGDNAPVDQGDYIRCYANNTITISTTGSNMTQIVIAWTKNSKKTFASVTANSGTYTHPSGAGNGTWRGNAQSVVFTVGASGQIQITQVTITAGSTKTLHFINHKKICFVSFVSFKNLHREK